MPDQYKAPTPPTYVINPLLQRAAWTGDDWGFQLYPSKNWLNSVWLGTVWNFMCLPQRFYCCVIVPLLGLQPVGVAIGLMAFFVNTTAQFFAGLYGRLIMLPYPLEVISDSVVLSPSRAQAAIEAGMFSDGAPVARLTR